jgi:hypothetical protein
MDASPLAEIDVVVKVISLVWQTCVNNNINVDKTTILFAKKDTRCYNKQRQNVPLNVEPATIACRSSSSDRNIGILVSHNAEHSRCTPVG